MVDKLLKIHEKTCAICGHVIQFQNLNSFFNFKMAQYIRNFIQLTFDIDTANGHDTLNIA